jgi:transcriptional accessory protein Tex/SPT6
VNVTVMEVDHSRKRIALSMKSNATVEAQRKPGQKPEAGKRDLQRHTGGGGSGGGNQGSGGFGNVDWFTLAQKKK